MFYYPHHIGDFIRDTANLSDSQTMAYLRMLWKYYNDESPLVGPCDRIAFAVRSDEKTVALILGHYFTETHDGWRHSRCDSVISAFYEKSEKAAASARKRWEHANASKTDANAMPTDSERNSDASKNDATQYPIPNTQQPEKIKNKKPRTATPVAELDFSGWPSKPSESVLAEWLAMRKRKKAAVTQLVVDQFGKVLHEASIIGWTVDEALSKAVMRGWQGLEIDWLPPKKGGIAPQTRPQSKQAQGMAAIMEMHNGFLAQDRNQQGNRKAVLALPGRDSGCGDDPIDDHGLDRND